jgi:glycosyltransferase involved in cell wall biosynthesis
MEQNILAVSVLMTAYNREPYIGEAVESVLRSTFSDFELIVADDHSLDGTVDIVRRYEARDPRIRVVVNEKNLGDYSNRNEAAAHARGKYLKYLDSDDAIYPHGLEVMVRCMEAYPDAALGLSAIPDPAGPCPRYLTPADAYREHFFERDLLGRAPGSAIIRRTAFEAVGGFSGLRQVGDHELWLKIARRFPVVKMPTDLVWDRQHPDQEKHYDGPVEKALMHEEVQIAALNADDCPLNAAERAAALERLAESRARNYWQLLRSRGGLRLANRYRRDAEVSAGDIARFAWGRVSRSAVSPSHIDTTRLRD